MSLMRLLNAGSSLALVKDVGRYNVNKNPFVLPKFGGEVKPAATAPAPVAEAAPAEAPAPARAPGSRWWQKANPFAPAAAKPVQSELSLDKVQVMRNDLNDSDIEIIAKAPPGTTLPKKRYVRPAAEPDDLGKKAWGILGSRLFGGAAAKH
jgi:hypothetical protein